MVYNVIDPEGLTLPAPKLKGIHGDTIIEIQRIPKSSRSS